MKKKIPRKWEYVAKLCRHEGYVKSAEVADEIDKILDRLYKQKHTAAWRRDFPPDCLDIHEVASITEFCIACVVHKHSCYKCKFMLKTGKCTHDESLLSRFFTTLDREGFYY